MLWTPASAAFLRQAAPESESRLTIIRTVTSWIMLSQMLANLDLSPWAFWMSESTPAALNAAVSAGRSLASHRGEVVASGRITPTLPASEEPPPPPLLLLLSSPPQAASAPNASTPVATREATRAPFIGTILLDLHGCKIL